jgi:Rubredoxin metal binding domain
MAVRRRSAEPTLCQSCGRTTQTVIGRCPHCGSYKPGEEPAWAYRPRWWRGPSITDDLTTLAIMTVVFLPGPALIVLGILWLGGTVVLAGVLLLAGAVALYQLTDWW